MSSSVATCPRVVVIGGGLAGITAALDCADAGAHVTLLEVRPRLGGAVYSFVRDGLQIDNGQHVFLRCFAAYRALLVRLGSDSKVWLQPRFELPLVCPGGSSSTLRRSSLPAPLHLAGTLLRYDALTVRERLGVSRAAFALGRLDPCNPELDRHTLGEWLSAHGQSQRTIAALWDLIALPSLNLPAEHASLALAAFVFKRGLLERADAGDIGFHRHPQSEIVGDPALHALQEAGVEVRLGWRAERVECSEGDFTVHSGEESMHANAVIVALQRGRAAELIDPLDPGTAARARALRDTPIVNIHVVYDRRVCEQPFVGALESPVQYVFDRSESAGVEDGRQYLALSQSGADEEMSMNVKALRERYLPALAAIFPRAGAARVERFFATREHAATLRAAPGASALRPGPTTAVPGLVLAGAWTDTGWPATLESAVLSGHGAARAALAVRR
jgi:hydroxysqualene dehydroxylase